MNPIFVGSEVVFVSKDILLLNLLIYIRPNLHIYIHYLRTLLWSATTLDTLIGDLGHSNKAKILFFRLCTYKDKYKYNTLRIFFFCLLLGTTNYFLSIATKRNWSEQKMFPDLLCWNLKAKTLYLMKSEISIQTSEMM